MTDECEVCGIQAPDVDKGLCVTCALDRARTEAVL